LALVAAYTAAYRYVLVGAHLLGQIWLIEPHNAYIARLVANYGFGCFTPKATYRLWLRLPYSTYNRLLKSNL
jgi:hypothetical protein